MSVYDVELETLSPLHIGSGEELRQDFDFVTRNGLTYVLDVDKILEEKYDQLTSSGGRYPLPGKLLDHGEYGSYARYVLRGTPRSEQSDARVQAFIKDIYHCPYIPGSSLKGALRTGLAWSVWDEVQPSLNRGALGRSRSWAAQNIEKELFGPDPKHDLLRALQVSDLRGIDTPGEGMVLVNAQVVTKGEPGSPIELEALKSGVSFQGTIKIDDVLFSDWAKKLNFKNQKHWLEELMPRVHAHTQARVQPLLEWFNDAGVTRIANFYRNIEKAVPGEDQAVIQLGWGGGWDSKTFGSHLKENEELFKRILSDFRMRRGNAPAEKFPVSKRVVVKQEGKHIYPLAPFGWALVTMEKRS